MKRLKFLSVRRVAGACAVSLMAIASLPTGAAAATVPITFGVSLRTAGDCIAVQTAGNNATDVTLRNSSGELKAHGTVAADGVFFCLDNSTWVDSGDKLKASDGTYTRTFVVPNLSIEADRVNNRYFGTGPAGRTVLVEYPKSLFGDTGASRGVRVNADGTWSLNPNRDLIWSMDGIVDWKSPNGDRVDAYGAVPYVSLTIGKSTFSGRTSSFDSFQATIEDGHLGSANVTSNVDGRLWSKFRNAGGHRVKVAPGDHFSAPGLASDADWIVPHIVATANPANDKVHGNCEDTGALSGLVRVDVLRSGHGLGSAFIGSDENGNFSVDFGGRPYPGFEPANIKSGDTIVVGCMIATGDWVSESFPVS
jgi:hypothetical protein